MCSTASLIPFIRHPGPVEPALPSLARSVLFFNDNRSIMVGYLDSKEIVAWDIEPWRKMWACKLRKRIGSMAWSPETRYLSVWNLEDGVDVYRLHDDAQLRHLHKLTVNIRRNFVKVIDLVQHGRMAISGTDKGEINVWDAECGVLVQTLTHGTGALYTHLDLTT
ncbi:hypothetical protein OF83DRAFT_1061566 [Amylostereum chailletii]|nr:hypothetical protein OF83DRAFT_1061566 [Amylostereum chailletii]